MSFKTTVLSVVGAMAHVTVVTAQTPQPAASTSRTIVAATKLPSVPTRCTFFMGGRYHCAARQKAKYLLRDGILYRLPGN